MNDLEKLNKAIATARRVHESIAEGRNGDIVRGAMLEALETIAKLLPQAQTAQDPVCQPEPLSVAYKFDSELVDRLAQAAWTFDVRNDGLPWKLVNDAAKDNVRGHVLATLTELAKAPVELPSADELPAIYWRGQKRAGHESCDNLSGAGIGAVLEYIGAHIAPAIAARDAEITRQSERIADLEKRLAQKEREHLITIEKAADHAKRAADLEKRLAEQTSVNASGKTPGQVDYEAYGVAKYAGIGCRPWERLDESTKAANEAGAAAVLHAFGGEALRRVRDAADANDTSVGQEHRAILIPVLNRIIDAELAKLGAKE